MELELCGLADFGSSICTAVTAATIHLDSEEVELLCILPYSIGQGQNVHVVKWLTNGKQGSQTVKSLFAMRSSGQAAIITVIRAI